MKRDCDGKLCGTLRHDYEKISRLRRHFQCRDDVELASARQQNEKGGSFFSEFREKQGRLFRRMMRPWKDLGTATETVEGS